jgi:hypothetical protein
MTRTSMSACDGLYVRGQKVPARKRRFSTHTSQGLFLVGVEAE